LQVGVLECGDASGTNGTRDLLEPRVGRAPGGERDLLLEDDLDQRLEAGSAVPEGRHAVARDDGGEVRIPAGELGDALRERPGRQLERHVNLTSSGGLV